MISLKGEEKARKQNRAYYGADGKLTKVPIGAPPAKAESQGGGGGRSGRLKERVVENKKDEMQEYMQKAVALVHKYVPPAPELSRRRRTARSSRFSLLRPDACASSSRTSCSPRT